MNEKSKTNSGVDGNKFLLVKGSSGLGNRIECVLTAVLYARLTGRRLIVDWTDNVYSNDESNVFHRFFQCSLCNPTDQIPDTDSVNPSIWRGHLHESAKHMVKHYANSTNQEIWRRFSFNLTKLDHQEDVLVMWTYHEKLDLFRAHFKGEFKELSQMSRKAILSKLLREDLILHPEIQERVNRFKENNFHKKTVGVHVRYTDHRGNLWTTLKELKSVLNSEPGLQIFLATDNIQIKNMFEESYPNLITTPHWYSTAGLPLHGNRNCPDLLESGVEALVDLYLLAECDYLILDNSSSFSYLANLLTKTRDSHIFGVSNRRKLSPRLRKLSWWLMVKLGLFSWGLSTFGKFVRIQKFLSR